MISFRFPPRSRTAFVADVRRIALGCGYALRPRRVAALPHVLLASVRTSLGLERPDACLEEDDPRPRHPLGFVGPCGTMSPDALMRGFSKGLFPFSHVGAKRWWMHPERMTLAPADIVRDKDVRRMIRNRRFSVTFDTAFVGVMRACAEPRPGQTPLTWITDDIVEAYGALHRAGDAHSFEVWNADGDLVGGGFGIAVGTVFVIESQFTRERNASKIGMVVLLRHLHEWGFDLADGKGFTPYLHSMGFRPMPHDAYVALLRDGLDRVPQSAWEVDETLDAAEWSDLERPGEAA